MFTLSILTAAIWTPVIFFLYLKQPGVKKAIYLSTFVQIVFIGFGGWMLWQFHQSETITYSNKVFLYFIGLELLRYGILFFVLKPAYNLEEIRKNNSDLGDEFDDPAIWTPVIFFLYLKQPGVKKSIYLSTFVQIVFIGFGGWMLWQFHQSETITYSNKVFLYVIGLELLRYGILFFMLKPAYSLEEIRKNNSDLNVEFDDQGNPYSNYSFEITEEDPLEDVDEVLKPAYSLEEIRKNNSDLNVEFDDQGNPYSNYSFEITEEDPLEDVDEDEQPLGERLKEGSVLIAKATKKGIRQFLDSSKNYSLE